MRYDLSGANDRELPLTLAIMPVLSRAHTDAEHFEDQTLQIPVAPAPIGSRRSSPGERLVLKRDPNYWARDLPISSGLYNFDTIRIDYFRDATAMFEAFKAGLIDFRIEEDATRWRSEYDFPAVEGRPHRHGHRPERPAEGRLGLRLQHAPRASSPTRGCARRSHRCSTSSGSTPISIAGAFKRSEGFFDDSDLSSIGRPASDARARAARALPRRGARRRDGGPVARAGLRRHRPRSGLARAAIDELAARGLRRSRTAASSIAAERRSRSRSLVKNREEERLALAYARNLARIGVAANVRLVDEVQFQRRRTRFDFDMMIGTWTASPSPGNEQRGRWSSAAANAEGAYNISGAASPAIDAMIAAILAARTNEDFVAAVRALDRVLISGFYIVPLYYAPEQWIAYSSKLGRPDEDAAVRRRSRRLVETRAVSAKRARPLAGYGIHTSRNPRDFELSGGRGRPFSPCGPPREKGRRSPRQRSTRRKIP